MSTMLGTHFGKIVALMRSTQFEGERDAARAKAEQIARNAGLTLEQALNAHDRATQKAAQPQPKNPFAGFDEWMEEKEPGWKARRTAEKDEKRRASLARKMALIERYGSLKTALAPCWREEFILEAVKPWRKACKRPHQRWTESVDGWRDGWSRNVPDRVREAIGGAYPLPETFVAAKREHDYWNRRRGELEDLLDDVLGDDMLDLVCQIRANMVRDLAEHELPVSTLEDLHARFAIMMASESHEPDMDKALFRDLSAMIEQKAARADAAASQSTPNRPDISGRISEALRADPVKSDRFYARQFRCSPTTVGNVRRELGLTAERRSVQRGGQTYQMNASRGGRA